MIECARPKGRKNAVPPAAAQQHFPSLAPYKNDASDPVLDRLHVLLLLAEPEQCGFLELTWIAPVILVH